MKPVLVTTKSKEEIAADFEAAFADIKPPTATKRLTQADRLAPYRPHIMKLRRRGLTWVQIAKGMAHPRIAVTVSEKTLRKLFGTPPAVAQPVETTAPAAATEPPPPAT